ncbi:MAG: ATP-dependent helicase, partial [Lachnospiraceae bacterium]|nr:ATP-dependent helicase [Lachnospiraceae bacterium]
NEIKAGPGSLLVTAGPGSGKTAVLTQRVIYLNNQYNIPFDKILVITFTKAAAASMKSRFEKEYPGESKVTFCTFHSLFYSIIKDFKSENFLIISLKEKLNILKTVLIDMSLDISRLDLNEILDEISKVKNLDLNTDNYVSKSIEPEKFKDMFNYYHDETKARNLIDYDDFVILAEKMFDKNPDFLKKWTDKYAYCLIDEFQDINSKQYDMVKRLFNGKGVFAVGDEDQSIYAFRGSSSDICLKFKKDFNADVMKLETNYRSKKSIVKAGMNLISFNSLRFDKRIVPDKKAKEGEFKVKGFDTYKEEYEVMVKEAKDGLFKGKSVAILLRTNNIHDALQYCLLKYKVPYITEKTTIKIKNNEFIEDILTYFKIAAGENTYSNLLKISNKPNRYISRSFLSECKLNERYNDDYYSYVNLFNCSRRKKYLSINIFKFERNIKELCKLDSFEGLIYIMKVIGYEKYLFEKGIKFETEFEELKSLAREFTSKEDLIDYFDLIKDEDTETNETKEDDGTNKVRICTIHASKGREWDEVYIPDVNEGNIPHKKALSKEETEDERRLFYVAMTRAREKLWVCYVDDIKRNLKPSLFVKELK